MDVTDKIISALLKDIERINKIELDEERRGHELVKKASQSLEDAKQTKKKNILKRAYNHTAKTLKKLIKRR